MRHTFHQLYCHFVWHTKDSMGLITEPVKPCLLSFIEEEVTKLGATCLAVNAIKDHVHLLIAFLPQHSPADLIGKVKGASSYQVNHRFPDRPRLQWQEGYGAVTLRKHEVPKCIAYIEEQETHHGKGEAAAFLERFFVSG